MMLESDYGSFKSVQDVILEDLEVRTKSLGVLWCHSLSN
jgi:hypothetical protein